MSPDRRPESHRPHHRRHRGFSLLEVMVVLFIIGLLAGLMTVNVTRKMNSAKVNAAKAEIAMLAKEVEGFYLERGRYPTVEEGLQAARGEGEVLAPDPWGRPYEYVAPGQLHAYEIVSYGSDGQPGGEGADRDIDNWNLRDVIDAQ